MGRAIISVTAAALAAVVAVSVRCDLVSGGPPAGLRIAAQTDSTVRVSWVAPAQGTPNSYLVYFMETGIPSFVPLGETEDTVFTHNPHGATGIYKVMARFGGETYEAEVKPSTVPVLTDSMVVGELNTTTRSGYSWARGSGVGATFAMDDQLNADGVDLYITDFKAGAAGPKYWVASPELGPQDPGGGVPMAPWRTSGFSPSLVYERSPLPAHDQYIYLDRRQIDTVPMAVGCYTEDGYYALVKFTEASPGLGRVTVKSWFQLVRGLRLIKH